MSAPNDMVPVLLRHDALAEALDALGETLYRINARNGWDVTVPDDWRDGDEVVAAQKIGAKLALIHSEVSEALEAVRKGTRDDFAEEMADVLIRLLDTTHGLGIDLAPIIIAKLQKNAARGHRHGGRRL